MRFPRCIQKRKWHAWTLIVWATVHNFCLETNARERELYNCLPFEEVVSKMLEGRVEMSNTSSLALVLFVSGSLKDF